MSEAEFIAGMRQLGLEVSRETSDKLRRLEALLNRWQKAINLVGPASLRHVWTRHFLDSAQIAPLLPEDAATLADLGTGAGFPGLILALLRPGLSVTLVESDARKGAYLGEAVRTLGFARPPKVIVGRIEAVPPLDASVVTARALAPLAKLLEWGDRHRAKRGQFIFHKGASWRDELTEAMVKKDLDYEPISSVTDRDAVILRIRP